MTQNLFLEKSLICKVLIENSWNQFEKLFKTRCCLRLKHECGKRRYKPKIQNEDLRKEMIVDLNILQYSWWCRELCCVPGEGGSHTKKQKFWEGIRFSTFTHVETLYKQDVRHWCMFKLLGFLRQTPLRETIYLSIALVKHWRLTGLSHLIKLSEPLNNRWLTIKVDWPKSDPKNTGLKERESIGREFYSEEYQ